MLETLLFIALFFFFLFLCMEMFRDEFGCRIVSGVSIDDDLWGVSSREVPQPVYGKEKGVAMV